jgi:hypothetical protein
LGRRLAALGQARPVRWRHQMQGDGWGGMTLLRAKPRRLGAVLRGAVTGGGKGHWC